MIYIILAGGKGTRLQSVVKDVPKPMAPVNGRPFLEFVMERLLQYNAEEFILSVSYKSHAVMSYFGSSFRGVPIKYSVEEVALGTGGAIKKSFDVANAPAAIAVNGDTLVDADYTDFTKECQKSMFGMMLAKVEDTGRYGKVEVKGGRIMNFVEKGSATGSGLINAGCYWLTKEVADLMPSGAFSFENEFLVPYARQLEPSYYITHGYFIDIGVPDDYFRACREIV